MQQGYLICEMGGKDTRKVLVGAALTVGRALDSGLTIDDTSASRRHLEILAKQEGFFWKDLGSTNGTLLNGARMLEGRLRNGDLIQIGETVLRFVIEDIPDRPGTADDSTIFKETIINRDGLVQSPTTTAPSKSDELLRAVYTIMNEIATNYEPCSLVDRILETTIKAVDAQRGAVLFANEELGQLAPCPVCNRIHVIEDGKLKRTEPGEIMLSHTVTNRVLSGGESVLYLDSDQDGALNSTDSILSLRLRSIICVPLRGKMGISGVLYMDSNRPGQQYSHDDMLLSTAVGNSAGLALENARMHLEILEKQRTDQEIEYAWTIQEGFLVKQWPQDDRRFSVYGETRPAKIIGGDFYDFVRPADDTVGILIGDVSGKGVPAALAMAQLLAEFRLHARALRTPVEVLRALNAGLVTRSQRGMFCTLCYATLDLNTGRLACANAGHHPILRIGAQQSGYLGKASGPPTGVLTDSGWNTTEDQIAAGDTLLMFTDGIVEARGATTQVRSTRAPNEFGSQRLQDTASALYGQPPKAIIDHINQQVREFCAPAAPHDDCTMIALRFQP